MAKDYTARTATIQGGAYGLFVLGAVLRVLSLSFSKNTGGDALQRAALTARWLQHPTSQLIFGVYPPGHFWLIGTLALLVPDVTMAGRLLSLLLGIASLFFVWKLACLLYGNAAGIFSLAVFTLYSMHIAYSTTSSSEVPCVFFLLFGLFFFFSYFNETSPPAWYLGVSGIALSVAGSIRYEAWVIFGALVLIFPWLWIWSPIRRGPVNSALMPLILFGITGGAWPLMMMLYCWRNYGDPMYLVTLNHLRVTRTLETVASPLGYQLALTPVVLIISLSPLAFAGAMWGIARSRRLPLAAAFAALTIFFAAVQDYEIVSHGLLALARYSLILGAMLCVISGGGLEAACRKFFPRRIELARFAVIAFLILNLGAILALSELPNRYEDKFASVSPRLSYLPRIAGVAEYLRTQMGTHDAVVIDDYKVESNIVASAAGLSTDLGRRAYLASAQNEVNVREYIHREHPRFLVYSDQGTLRSSLNLPQACNQANLDGVEFRCTYANHIYRVYELSYR
ncbi:MAG TPA: glycosyltransferase family 39 protein [Candidatus Dormibacteraeota bacterium]|jgi:4-amino-4-deoxy-L-arabinose transferase-like glycosyltransferase|nr:glycosyltransferase family 39 protein [Candidatus Dormibacteraeota bacterium]